MIGFRAMCEELVRSHYSAVQIAPELLVNNNWLADRPGQKGPYVYMLINDEEDRGMQIPLTVEKMTLLRDWLDRQIVAASR